MEHFLIGCAKTGGLFSLKTVAAGVPQAARELFLDGLGPFTGWIVGLRLQLPILSKQNLDFAFGLLQFLTTRGGMLQAFFKEFQCLFERDITSFQLIHDLFQTLKTIFKLRHRAETPWHILTR
jgi:hypothetical protein